ncbi:unnamed protein product, partial [Strongylus vulgaris]
MQVSTFWPKFAKHGKADVTIRDVLDHKAGLVSFGPEFGIEDARKSELISTLIEEAVPLWTPGTKRGYHALSYGFLVDEVIKRLHPQKHSVSQIYEDEVWSEAVTELPLISCMGVGTAEGFAKAIHQKGLISNEVWKSLCSPTTIDEEDIVLSHRKPFGHGFTYEPHPVYKGNVSEGFSNLHSAAKFFLIHSNRSGLYEWLGMGYKWSKWTEET